MRNHILTSALALSAALAATALTSAAQARPMTAEDLATLSRVAAPVASADGRYIAYQMTETQTGSYDRSTSVLVLDRNQKNTAAIRLNSQGTSADSPAFGPDGQIYYLSGGQIWRIAPTGGTASQVTQTKADISGFKISPDGSRLLVWGDIAMDCADFGCDAPTANADGDANAKKAQGTGRLYKDGVGFVRHWDSWETPGTHSRLFVLNLADGKASVARPISAGLVGDAPSKPFGGGEEVSWGPDSRTVYFTLRKADAKEPTSTNLDIYRAIADARIAPVNLTVANEATDTLPTPSADGKYLAYAAMARAGYEADRQVLMLRDLASGETRALTDAWDRSVSSIAWSPDGKSLLVTAQDVLDHPMFRVDVASGKVEKLRATREEFEGTIGDVTPLADGSILFSRNSIAAPNDLWLRDAKGKITRLTDVNRAKMAEIDPVKVNRLRFAGANGDTVWGQIVKPAHASGKLPVAFLVHGGPQGSFGNSWSFRWNPRTFAAPGYAAVSVDFHGSTGYGQAFTDSINKDWGGKPLEDLKLGLAAAGKQDPQIDITNACALGGSYGGYMMNWIAGNWNDGFKCLINHAGVFDTRAMAFETEELWFDEWENGGPWWDRPDAEKWNPVNHVKNWKTPMLVIHGEKDFRIPYTQGLAAFHALQRQGIKGELLMFPDENHWINKGKNSVQWYDTVFNWMGDHLKK